MKKILFLTFSLLLTFQLSAQELQETELQKTRQQEVGFAFSSLNYFGFIYKIGRPGALWRVGVEARGNVESDSHNFQSENDTSAFIRSRVQNSYYLNVGKEFRKSLGEHLELRYGADLTTGYSQMDHKEEQEQGTSGNQDEIQTVKDRNYSVGVMGIVGLNYVVNNRWVFGGRLSPQLNYTKSYRDRIETNNNETSSVDSQSLSYDLGSRVVTLSVSLRF